MINFRSDLFKLVSKYLIVIASILYLPVSLAVTNLTSIIHVSGDQTFKWVFDCGAGGCSKGQFIGGSYWVAPKGRHGQVVLHSVSPDGEENGLEINPSSIKKQGFLSCQAKSYDKALNLMVQLPLKIRPSSSLVKSHLYSGKCGTKSILGCCVGSYDVVTVLKESPENGGESAFRPGFAGNDKDLYYLDDFDFKKIPKAYGLNKKKYRIDYSDIHVRWSSPYVDHFMAGIGDRGRAFSPHEVVPDYGAAQASLYLNDLLSVMSRDGSNKKLPAITGLIQRGIDLYASLGVGVYWPSGAGQTMGRKPPIAFFAALSTDTKVKEAVMKMSQETFSRTQEDAQIRVIKKENGGGGVPIWGDITGWCTPDFYWSQVFSSKNYSGATEASNPKGDSKRTCGDPYGWIDGPAGKPGTFYMACCTTGGFIAYVVAQNLMPELCRVANDAELLTYTKRVLYEGIHTSPDACAPPDPREVSSCRPYKKSLKRCLYYGETWGESLKKKGECVKNGTNGTLQNGRFPHMHGNELKKIYYEPNLSKYLRKMKGRQIFDTCNL